MRVRTNARKKRPGGAGPWLLHTLGRTLQVAGLLITLVAATAFFGTKSTVAMLRMMLVGVLVFLPGFLVVRHVERQQKQGRGQPQ